MVEDLGLRGDLQVAAPQLGGEVTGDLEGSGIPLGGEVNPGQAGRGVEAGKGLNPFQYLNYLFEKLPNLDIKDDDALDEVLPWSDSLPLHCRVAK